MEQVTLTENLKMVEARIKADDEQITRLEGLIIDFKQQGMHDWVSLVQKLLGQLEDTRKKHRAEREWLEAELARTRA